MKSFKEYLTESKTVDKNYDLLKESLSSNRLKSLIRRFNSLDPDEEFDEITESEIMSEGTSSPFDTTGQIINGDTMEKFVLENEFGNGDEFIFEDEKIQLDEGDKKIKKEKKKGDTDIMKFADMLKKNHPSLDEIRQNLQKIKLVDGKLKRRSDKFYGNYIDMTSKQIAEIINNLNSLQNAHVNTITIDKDTGVVYSEKKEIDENGKETITKKNLPIKSPASMKTLCNTLNEMTDWDIGGSLFWYDNREGSKEKILTISKDVVQKSKSNDKLYDFSDVKYIPISEYVKITGNSSIIDNIQSKLTKAYSDGREKGTGIKFGYNEETGKFTKNGKDLTDEEMLKFVRARSGMANPEDKYWNSFHFSAEGSKIGTGVGSFSLPPGETCLPGVPCRHEGCYAWKAFAQKPTTRAAWISNSANLRKGEELIKLFEEQCLNFIKEFGITHFRFHVSGDVDIGEFKQRYVEAICNVASRAGTGVKFWTYTKDYGAWKKATVPENMVVLFSAWGEKFHPDGNSGHPIAFLYDKGNTDNKYMRGIDIKHFDEYDKNRDTKTSPVVFCPCSDPEYKHRVTCITCGLCWDNKGNKHNVAFHKH